MQGEILVLRLCGLRRRHHFGYPLVDYSGEYLRSLHDPCPHAALSDAEMQSPDLVGRILDFTRLTLPLLEWGWAAMDEEPPALLPIWTSARRLPKPDFGKALRQGLCPIL